MREFSSHTRRDFISQIKKTKFKTDCLIVGGGIVGAGISRELAFRGVPHLLVEKSDFASGTSSKSSKLIHGGLRYLEMLDFHLVFEALSERNWLLKKNPHLIHPLEFDLLIYDKRHPMPGGRPPWLMSIGLCLYDALSLFRTPFFHGRHSKEKILSIFPGIKQDGLQGGFYYADAMMLDEELVLECIKDAVDLGAMALNYVEVVRVLPKNSEGYFEVVMKNNFSDDKNSSAAQESFHVFAKEVVGCVGPWTEAFGDTATVHGSQKKLKPSRGSHLVFDWKRLSIESCLVMTRSDGRIVFAIPRKDLGDGAEKTIVGTTDQPHSAKDCDHIFASEKEIEYLLATLNDFFPNQSLSQKDILCTYSGVRPLIEDGHSESKTSREHEIWKSSDGICFVAGGKYTTFRKMSQEIADFVFPKSKPRFFSKDLSFNSLSNPIEYASRFTGEKIWGRYTSDYLRWKIKYHCPLTFDDLIQRRIPVWMEGEKISPAILSEIKKIWSEFNIEI